MVSRFSGQGEYRVGEPVVVNFTLRNNSGAGCLLLARGTPLEGLLSPCLSLRSTDGHPLEYQGIYAKRGDTDPGEYVFVGPGETVNTTIDLADSYTLTRGTYTVRIDTLVQDVTFSGSSPRPGRRGPSRGASRQNEVRLRASMSFRLTGNAPPVRPKAERVTLRTAAVMKLSPTNDDLDGIRPALCNGGDAARRAQVSLSHLAASALCDASLAALGAPASTSFEDWFGDIRPSTVDEVIDNFAQVAAEFRTRDVYYDLTGYGCSAGWFAYTVRNTARNPRIYICPKFWTAPPSGYDSQQGVLLHELTHAVVGTWDAPGTSVQDARDLARRDPRAARSTADNYQYFAESL